VVCFVSLVFCMATSMGSNVGGLVRARLVSGGTKPLGWGNTDHRKHRVKIEVSNHALRYRRP